MQEYLERIKKGEKLKEQEVKSICEMTIDIIYCEPNILTLSSPITIIGDIHGQFYDLLNIFELNGSPKETKYVFLGDYVDRGYNSIECILLLFIYKLMYPDNITLIRGNHETRSISQVYGFYDEVKKKYGSYELWRVFCDVFDVMCVGAVINGRILCVHGGISPRVVDLNVLRRIDRFSDITLHGSLGDLMWSDPDEAEGFQKSTRGAGSLYGPDVTMKFLELNGLNAIVRSHQLVMEGYKYHFTEKTVVTVWGAPNYCYRCGNKAAMLRLDDDIEITDDKFLVYKHIPQVFDDIQLPSYFH
ncbi:Serine/threonine-protein phosphatase PP1-1 [Astathelohania contejeani]|uniref:Serine/threonine-protein phosphatase n=1 Tax=Astathelohania contejeani TaxID=164912 RepID=A0ABQ7I1A1_9MICR|nr:Serine/threonine-protein phosphatase PP1-1 [Thelohania contejeani]